MMTRDASAGEVLGPDLFQELPELLDLVLLLVRNHDTGLGEDLVGTPDRRAHPQREGDRVAGPRRDPYAVSDQQVGVEDVLLELGDLDGVQRLFERSEDVP